MEKRPTIDVGAAVQMRKPHACGANEWTVVSTGMDIRVRCGRCGRTVLMPRTQFERAVKQVMRSDRPETDRSAQS